MKMTHRLLSYLTLIRANPGKSAAEYAALAKDEGRIDTINAIAELRELGCIVDVTEVGDTERWTFVREVPR